MTELDTRAKPTLGAFRFALREATRPEHASLDAHPAFASLMDGRLDVDGFGRLMALFHAFYDRNDPVISEACWLHKLHRAGFEYAPRAAILRRDLASLCFEPMQPVPLDDLTLPALASPAAACGTLYVVEGSMLGGAVLGRAVESLFSSGQTGGRSYWRWCIEAGAKRWAMTCGAIESLAVDEAARTEMILSARAAFRAFDAWLRHWHDDARDAKARRRASC